MSQVAKKGEREVLPLRLVSTEKYSVGGFAYSSIRCATTLAFPCPLLKNRRKHQGSGIEMRRENGKDMEG